jgi:hypothetical protein
MLMVAADYERTRRAGTVTAEGSTALHYYPEVGGKVSRSLSLGVGATRRLNNAATIEVGQTADYSPSYFYRLFPSVALPDVGEPAPAAFDYRVDETNSFDNRTELALRIGNTRSNRFSVAVDHSATKFYGDIERTDLDIIGGRATLEHAVSRRGTLSVEYEYRSGEFGYGAQTTEQRLRMAATFSPALSRTRRAQFRFSLAPSAIRIPSPAIGIETTGTVYKIEAEAAAEYPFLRSWSMGGSYRRGVEYLAVLLQPVFTDAARVELQGLVSQRVDVSASGGYVQGGSVLQRTGSQFDTYTATARSRYSVNRSIAVYVEYLYYYYDFRRQTLLASGLPRLFEQHGVRMGVMLWTRAVGR